ncbi:MAG: hypothetical protein RMY16_14440 [Nostoc sp. DedQUE12b]|uniref:hypothetical protein n=1 Tax=Nostoc sp. DedQUE12b TaxID=3075398 RepID=UPI002AD1DD92|nr:hypothetical protein [Nostoc sp. DedQUE12b]MDZ8086736.1 hypothetical protein [Nostoc sp. DedQUE12b]
MFTRSELESKTIQELRDLCRRYGLKPTGNAGYKTSYVTSLIAFPAIALNQMQEGRGLRRLSFEAFQNIGAALDQMNSPTDEQAALIKITMERRSLHPPQSWEQQKLLNLYIAKQKLEEVMYLLAE